LPDEEFKIRPAATSNVEEDQKSEEDGEAQVVNPGKKKKNKNKKNKNKK
jgi:hypothetical protein